MSSKSNTSGRLRVAVVDPHPLVIVGLRTVVQFSADMEIVGQASNERELRRALHMAHVAVVDPSTASAGGVDLVSALKNEHPDVKLLVLTSNEARAYAQQVLRAGADGIASKRSDPDEIARAIRVVAGGDVHIDPSIARQLLGNGSPADTELSAREEEVLRLVAQGFGSKEAAARLGLSAKSIQTYRARAARKLKLRTRAEIVRYGIARGWLA